MTSDLTSGGEWPLGTGPGPHPDSLGRPSVYPFWSTTPVSIGYLQAVLCRSGLVNEYRPPLKEVESQSRQMGSMWDSYPVDPSSENPSWRRRVYGSLPGSWGPTSLFGPLFDVHSPKWTITHLRRLQYRVRQGLRSEGCRHRHDGLLSRSGPVSFPGPRLRSRSEPTTWGNLRKIQVTPIDTSRAP